MIKNMKTDDNRLLFFLEDKQNLNFCFINNCSYGNYPKSHMPLKVKLITRYKKKKRICPNLKRSFSHFELIQDAKILAAIERRFTKYAFTYTIPFAYV